MVNHGKDISVVERGDTGGGIMKCGGQSRMGSWELAPEVVAGVRGWGMGVWGMESGNGVGISRDPGTCRQGWFLRCLSWEIMHL